MIQIQVHRLTRLMINNDSLSDLFWPHHAEASHTTVPTASANSATETAASHAVKIGALMPMTGNLQASGENSLSD